MFRVPEFRALWAAELVSICGDQLARVAFSVLVYGRTGSAAWAAVVYALTFLPALLGGVLLGWVADRFRRREVMVVSDVARALLVVPLAVPGIPLALLCPLLVLVVVLAAPHSAAQGALLPEVLRGESALERGFAVRQITNQTAQIAGFALGGALLVWIDPSVAILANAGTFLFSALLVRFGVRARPAPTGGSTDGGLGAWVRDIGEGARTVFAHPRLRTLALAVWLVGCYVAPEALAAPLSDELGAGPAAVGLLMAADPAGSVLGAIVVSRWVPEAWRERMIIPFALLAGVPLVVSAFTPWVWTVVVLWALTGALCTAALVPAQASFVRTCPEPVRGRATGLAASGLIAAQGLAILVCGLVAEASTSAIAVAVCGAGGLVLAAALLLTRGARSTVAVSA
ncbi:MFS transporter [Pseudonocardia sp. WMMC193]|uniref:MFS transporter n=1 Tax=Pseudonocardia sp. WMMC193 TaxID=2911965 RepID=UPI001F446B14|nr:MFS transporter [Pseudonocardia sp. WMMC193]MCF7553226.1 MFS transporter [Pseudonocardia sp. WMMC193]